MTPDIERKIKEASEDLHWSIYRQRAFVTGAHFGFQAGFDAAIAEFQQGISDCSYAQRLQLDDWIKWLESRKPKGEKK